VVKEGETDGQLTEDLNPLFGANYDTVNAGPKMVASSYELITKEMGLRQGEMLFLSDNVNGKLIVHLLTCNANIKQRFKQRRKQACKLFLSIDLVTRRSQKRT